MIAPRENKRASPDHPFDDNSPRGIGPYIGHEAVDVAVPDGAIHSAHRRRTPRDGRPTLDYGFIIHVEAFLRCGYGLYITLPWAYVYRPSPGRGPGITGGAGVEEG